MTWVLGLAAFALALQCLEMLFVPKRLRFPVDIVVADYPSWLQSVLVRALGPLNLWCALGLVGVAGLWVVPDHRLLCLGAMILAHWMIALRWRGAFNGGSDAMLMLVLMGLVMAELGWPRLGAGWISAQLTLSYFIAGVVKLRQPTWREGRALRDILSSSRLGLTLRREWCVPLAWLILLFEVMFPLSWIWPSAFLGLAAAFHLANYYVFGLNRFVWSWIAAYPALLWCVQNFSL